MCQEALADLKMAIRAAGEHKQRISINIAIDGLRLRDEKTGDCLYHHPVHKISFIAQDMSDSRAFGYIFGSPDTGHRFFGIKTDKAASQVVIAMRDLFQVVFELKKKEIELAKQHIEQTQIKLGASLYMDSPSCKNGSGSSDHTLSKMRTIQQGAMKENGSAGASSKVSQPASEVIADLLDLEFELNSIQQGIHQMERITPSDPFGPSTKEDSFTPDPFGDSFAPASVFTSTTAPKQQSIAILPPPPSTKDTARTGDPLNVPPSGRHTLRRAARSAAVASSAAPAAPTVAANNVSKLSSGQTISAPLPLQEKHWFDQETESLFDEGELITPPLPCSTNIQNFSTVHPSVVEQGIQETRSSPLPAEQEEEEEEEEEENKLNIAPKTSDHFDVFTELDPLGTGRVKPYIDRKDFFQELKNPPKKVLKDLVIQVPSSEATAPLFQATFETGSGSSSMNESVSCPTSKDVVSSTEITTASTDANTTTVSTSTSSIFPAIKPLDIDPFQNTDPFDKSDPFAEDDFSHIVAFPMLASSHDPFDTGFADFTMFSSCKRDLSQFTDLPASTAHKKSAMKSSPLPVGDVEPASQSAVHGPLRVSLPPEKPAGDTSLPLPSMATASVAPRLLSSPSSTSSKGRSKSRLPKQTSLATGMVKLPSPKSCQRTSRFVKQMTVDGSSTLQHFQSSSMPPMASLSSHSDRKSPSNQGILESVTLRNRSVVTPSPPMVACFPETSDAESSRLSGSSAELAETAPEPPPRPATTLVPIKPPPLPPKRQQVGNIIKPPPRPPHGEHPHYDYIENYETSISPTPQDVEEVKSPPIPVPARRPRFADSDFSDVPQRPQRQYQSAAVVCEPDYLPPIPLLPPPQKKSAAADSSRTPSTPKPRTPVMTTIASILQCSSGSTVAPASEQAKQPVTAKSLNITVSQLTKTGLADLATALGVSPGHLSNMTLQDFANSLARIQAADNAEDLKPEASVIKRDKYDALRESVDDELEFKADFETNFEPPPVAEKLDDVFHETTFDKYAIFRQLIGQEKSPGSAIPTTSEHENKGEESKPLSVIEESKSMREEKKVIKPPEDRYAALREICFVEEGEKGDAGTCNEKECVTEVPELDNLDLLSLSREQSEGMDSSTMEFPSSREPQSIIESTIFEEDVNALEAEEAAVPEEAMGSTELSKSEMVSPVDINDARKEGVVPVQQDESPELEHESQSSPQESKQEETADGWAKFDVAEKPPSEGQSEGVVSPWSSDGKEFHKQPPSHPSDLNVLELDRSRRRRRCARKAADWHEDDESEEGWDEGLWRENGWSDSDDMQPYRDRMYCEEKRGRRRRVSPWKRNQRSSRDPSPWENEGKDGKEEENWPGMSKRWPDRPVDDEEDGEEYASWKGRAKHRGSSWDEESYRRHGSREQNIAEHEERWKRRTSPWAGGPPLTGLPGNGGAATVEGDRRSSWESSYWDKEDRYARDSLERRYSRRGEREEEYRWRNDYEMEKYGWGRRYCGPDEEYMRAEHAPRSRRQRYCRDRSRESPWEDEYSEQGDDESPRYSARKRNWPKRPNSASDIRRPPEKCSPNEYKARIMEKQQHSLPNVPRTNSSEKVPGYSFSERQYRDKSSGSRPRSREGQFGSDQEYDYWPAERPCRQERDGYEQRSQTLHPRRPPRHKKPGDCSYSQKSPFDDDFSMQTFEFVDANSSLSGDAEHGNSTKKKSPGFSHNISPIGLPTPSNSITKLKVIDRKKDIPEGEGESMEVVGSIHEPGLKTPTPEDMSKVRGSKGSSHRQSPFEDNFTPPESRNASARLTSSISSDISDHRRSPFEDIRSSDRVASVVEESECENENGQKNGKVNDDVFLPSESATDPGQSVCEPGFVELESCATIGDVHSLTKPVDKRLTGNLWNTEDSNRTEKHFVGIKGRMSNLLRADSSWSLRKSESINIFARESDPFDDDFFSSDVVSSLPRPKSEQGQNAENSNVNNNASSDPFNWTKAFDSFNFEEEK